MQGPEEARGGEEEEEESQTRGPGANKLSKRAGRGEEGRCLVRGLNPMLAFNRARKEGVGVRACMCAGRRMDAWAEQR